MAASDPRLDLRGYRRGLLLGFTLSELSMLLVFALLLAFGGFIAAKAGVTKARDAAERRAELLAHELKDARAEAGASQALLEKVAGEAGVAPNKFDDFFRELRLAQSQKEAAERALEEARKATASAEARARDLAEKAKGPDEAIRKLEEITGRAKAILGKDATPEQALSLLDDVATAAAAIAPDATKGGPAGKAELARKVADLVRDNKDKAEKVETLQGRVKILQSQFAGLGKGANYPPCWISPETGKPEYIFDVAITELGIIVRDVPNEQRSAEKAKLPLSQIKYDRVQPVSEFRTATVELFALSEKENCRFFVRMFDQARSKDMFKSQMLGVEEHFYKFLTKDPF